MQKNATVVSNDPKSPQIQLTISGQVEKFVSIIPSEITLRGFAGEAITASAKIIPEPKYPFNIVNIENKAQADIRCRLDKLNTAQAGGYVLFVENLKKEEGHYVHMVSLKTDSPIRPTLNISVYGQILSPGQKEKL